MSKTARVFHWCALAFCAGFLGFDSWLLATDFSYAALVGACIQAGGAVLFGYLLVSDAKQKNAAKDEPEEDDADTSSFPIKPHTMTATIKPTWTFHTGGMVFASEPDAAEAMWHKAHARPETHGEPVPDSAEPVLGYRSWSLNGGALHSLNQGMTWFPGRNEGTCSIASMYAKPEEEWQAVVPECQCGLYGQTELLAALQTQAWQAVNTSRTMIWATGTNPAPQQVVSGVVKAWGRIQMHENGFRAQYAEIVALLEAPDIAPVAERYGVRVIPMSSVVRPLEEVRGHR